MKLKIALILSCALLVSSNIHAKNDHQKNKHKSLPPGLAKNLARGKPLPPGWQKKIAKGEILSHELYRQGAYIPNSRYPYYGRLPAGTRTMQIADRIFRIINDTREVLEVIQ